MATIELQKTKFTFSVLPLKWLSKGFWARTEIAIENEYISYRDIGESISRDELEECICSLHRLLAGAYAKEYTVSFERAGLAVDLYPYTENGMEVSRAERREHDCVAVVRILMRDRKEKSFLGGVYSVMLHREELAALAEQLRAEFERAFAHVGESKGKYLFVGVSPKGYRGCCYWYLDPTGTTVAGDYVWVRMGRHNTEQIVYVDAVRRCTDDTAPYDPARVKQVLRKATKDELAE